MNALPISELAEREKQRREVRNARDRAARAFIREHPELKESPNMLFDWPIPEETTESTIRSIARHYCRMKEVRDVIRNG